MKTLSDSYLYQLAACENKLEDHIKLSKRVDKKSEAFNDVVELLKFRQVSPIILKVLMSNKVVLLMGDPGAPRAFKVMYRKDLMEPNGGNKAFIDCTGIIKYDENQNKYICKNVGVLMSYIITAMTYVIFYNMPNLITSNNILVQSSTEAFVDFMIYVLSYLKVPVSALDNKQQMCFVLAEYFLYCVMQKDNPAVNLNVAKKIAGIDDVKKAEYLHALFMDVYSNPATTIKDFIEKFGVVFLDQGDSVDKKVPKNKVVLTSEAIVSKWSYAFGPGTFLGLELFVPFTAILTDCYVGSYVNNQNTIENIAKKNVTKFSNELIKVGSENS